MLTVLVIQIIPETTAVAEPENAAKLDKLIAVLAKLSLEEDDEVSRYPVFANESTQPHDSEVFIYPGFLADVDGQHEQVDDSNNFVHQCDSNANDNDKYNSGESIYPAAVDVDSAEPVVTNDVFGEVKDVNTDPDTDIFNVPVSHFIVESVLPLLTIDRLGILEHLSTLHRTRVLLIELATLAKVASLTRARRRPTWMLRLRIK
jgi:hypothetical protein